jgi:hypothetical protein
VSAARGMVVCNAATGVIVTPTLPEVCSKAEHDALKASEAWWDAKFIGVQRFEDCALELRNCPRCDSTLAVEVVR